MFISFFNTKPVLFQDMIISEWSDFQKSSSSLLLSDYESMFFCLSSGCDESKKVKLKVKVRTFLKNAKSAKESNAKTFPQLFFFRLLVVVLKVSSEGTVLFSEGVKKIEVCFLD